MVHMRTFGVFVGGICVGLIGGLVLTTSRTRAVRAELTSAHAKQVGALESERNTCSTALDAGHTALRDQQASLTSFEGRLSHVTSTFTAQIEEYQGETRAIIRRSRRATKHLAACADELNREVQTATGLAAQLATSGTHRDTLAHDVQQSQSAAEDAERTNAELQTRLRQAETKLAQSEGKLDQAQRDLTARTREVELWKEKKRFNHWLTVAGIVTGVGMAAGGGYLLVSGNNLEGETARREIAEGLVEREARSEYERANTMKNWGLGLLITGPLLGGGLALADYFLVSHYDKDERHGTAPLQIAFLPALQGGGIVIQMRR